jgi:hypothetical protein
VAAGVNAAAAAYKSGYFRKSRHSLSNIAGANREAVIDFELLRGRQNETVVKELCIASVTASETFRFKYPYKMADYGSSENGINWADGHIEYKYMHTVVTEGVAGFAHLYAYGVSKVTFLSSLTERTIHNLQDMDCPTPDSFNHKHWCTMPCQKFPKIACATETAHFFYDWLMHCLQTKDYVQCPSDMSRHTASFVAAL